MRKSKAARIAGFTVALGATASLVGVAASGTGAYFTDSHDGHANVTSGAVKVDTSGADALDFTNLLPEDYKTQTVQYKATGTGPEDIWLVLNQTGDDYLNGQKGTAGADAALGRYGHFAVDAPAGSFTSYNLTTAPAGTDPNDASLVCPIDANGHGGSTQEATDRSDYTVPWCGAPQYILLSSNLQSADGWQSANITFGFTKLLHDQTSNSALAQIPFQIEATQHGIAPNDPNN